MLFHLENFEGQSQVKVHGREMQNHPLFSYKCTLRRYVFLVCAKVVGATSSD